MVGQQEVECIFHKINLVHISACCPLFDRFHLYNSRLITECPKEPVNCNLSNDLIALHSKHTISDFLDISSEYSCGMCH